MNKPAHVLGLGQYPHDPDQHALFVVKTNADDGLFQGSLLFSREQVDLTIDDHSFTVARSIRTGDDPTCLAEDVFKPTVRRGPDTTKTDQARDVILTASWIPATADDAKDESWYAEQLEHHAQIRLDPKNVGKVLTALYESGINYVDGKKGPGGSKKRYWRQQDATPPASPMTDTVIDDFRDEMDDLLSGD